MILTKKTQGKLEYYGICGVAKDWFTSYLSDRKQVVTANTVISDQQIISCGINKNISTLFAKKNLKLTKIHTWLCANKLSLNAKKSKYVVFHPRPKKNGYS